MTIDTLVQEQMRKRAALSYGPFNDARRRQGVAAVFRALSSADRSLRLFYVGQAEKAGNAESLLRVVDAAFARQRNIAFREEAQDNRLAQLLDRRMAAEDGSQSEVSLLASAGRVVIFNTLNALSFSESFADEELASLARAPVTRQARHYPEFALQARLRGLRI